MLPLDIESKIDFVGLAVFLKTHIDEPSNFYDIEVHLNTYFRDIVLTPDMLPYIMSILVDLGIVVHIGKRSWFSKRTEPKIIKMWGVEIPDGSNLETRT